MQPLDPVGAVQAEGEAIQAGIGIGTAQAGGVVVLGGVGSGPGLASLDVGPFEVEESQGKQNGVAPLEVELVGDGGHPGVVGGVTMVGLGAVAVVKAGLGEQAEEVVEVVAGSGLVPFDQADGDELAQGLPGGVRVQLPDGGSGGLVEGAGEDGQGTPAALEVGSEEVVAEADGGIDQVEAGAGVLEGFEVVS